MQGLPSATIFKEADQSSAGSEIGPLPAVDVIIPVRNRPELVQICLDSVRAQSLQPNAVIVVDDGSTDDTAAVVADYAHRWPRLHLVRSKHRGAAHARNIGLAACKAPFIAFLDSDDVWHPNKLQRQMALFNGRPEVGLVHCGCVAIDERGERLRDAAVLAPSKRGQLFEEMINTFYHLVGSASAIVTRRDLAISVGGFDESLLHIEDQDMWLKLARISQVDFVPDPLVGIQVHKGNHFAQTIRSDPALALLQKLAVWSKWINHADEHILQAFRREAFSVNQVRPFRLIFHFRFYQRLKNSEWPLARRLFPDFFSYLRHVFSVLHPGKVYRQVKFTVATKLILRYKTLLRLAHILGKFRGIDPAADR